MNKTTKRWLIFLGAAAVIFILANAITILLTNPEPEVPATVFVQTNIDNTTSTFSNVSFTGPTPDLPPTAPIATTQNFTTSENDVVGLIIQQFNLEANATFSNLWTNDLWALSKSSNNLYTLVKNQYRPLENSGMNPELTIRTAQTFIDSYFQELQISLITNDVRYFENILEPDNPSQMTTAQLAKVPFSYTIAGYPVFYEQNSLYPFEVWVTAENEVTKFTYYPQFIQLQEIGSKPLISIDQAIENINTKNLGSVISYNNQSTTIVSLDEVEQADLDTISLEYRVDSTTKLAFPFYRFSGVALLSGIETPLEITTPAVVVE